MFESILKIGDCLKKQSGDSFPIKPIKAGLAAKIVFDLDESKILLDAAFECKGKKAKELAREFLWIGNARGNAPQLRLTTNRPSNLLNAEEGHKWAIGSILKYIEEKGLSSDDEIRSVYQYLEQVKEKYFPNNENLMHKIKELCQKQKIDFRQITLYTISIRKKDFLVDLAKEPGYKKLLRHIILYEKTSKYPQMRGKCHICNREGEVLINPDYPKGTFLSIYVIDKAGFLSGVSRSNYSLLRTHAICVDCKESLTLGINFVDNNLSVKIGDLNALIIPTLIGKRIDADIIEGCKEAFKLASSYGTLKKIEAVERKIAKKLGVVAYAVSIVFGKPQQSQFIFEGFIQDVPIMRFVEIANHVRELSKNMTKYFAEGVKEWFIGFSGISKIFPLPKMKRGVMGKPLIELFDAMLSKTYYPKEHLLKRALLYAKIHRFGNYGRYNIEVVDRKERDIKICRALLLYNLLINLLARLEAIGMETKKLLMLEGIDKQIIEFCKEQNYSEWQAGLFMLGVLIGKIGTQQVKKDDKKKSILSKIDFDGMSIEKIKRLTNSILEGLRNYNILDRYNEGIYAQAKKLIDKNIVNLKNPIDNTFYILSGYAYATLSAIIGGGEFEGVTE